MLLVPANATTPDAAAPRAAAFDVALRAIAEPTRTAIVALLAHGEHCVCDVGSALRISPALVSHHLRVLRRAGLVRERRAGRWVYCSLDLDNVRHVRILLDALLDPPEGLARRVAGSACACTDAAGEWDAGVLGAAAAAAAPFGPSR